MQFQPYSSSEVRPRKLRDDSGKSSLGVWIPHRPSVVSRSSLVSTSSCRSVDDKGLLEGDAFTALQNYSTLNCAHLCILCIMTQRHHTLISYQLTFWTPLLIGFTIDTYQNNYYLRWELRLVSLIEGIKADGKD